MKTSHIRFKQLQRLLTALGFAEAREEAGWRFEHDESNTLFLFRPYRLTDLFLVRSQLDARGLLTEDAFDESLTKTPA
jgi:hypothetical protein